MYLLFPPLFIMLNINKGLKLEISAQTAWFHQEMQRMNRTWLIFVTGILGQCQRQCPAAAAVNDTTGPDGNIALTDQYYC